MKATVLFCDSVSFDGSDGRKISGFRVGVIYTMFDGTTHCREVWSRTAYNKGDTVKCVYSKKKEKHYVFPWED